MMEFRIGDRVTFETQDRGPVFGILTRYKVGHRDYGRRSAVERVPALSAKGWIKRRSSKNRRSRERLSGFHNSIQAEMNLSALAIESRDIEVELRQAF
jgi:hypothetical protein